METLYEIPYANGLVIRVLTNQNNTLMFHLILADGNFINVQPDQVRALLAIRDAAPAGVPRGPLPIGEEL